MFLKKKKEFVTFHLRLRFKGVEYLQNKAVGRTLFAIFTLNTLKNNIKFLPKMATL